ncbi:type I-E CRISPR-associated endonuclease Cas1e [Zavarzinia compransoris]|uniref:CRISPR-associated endonuclease Cas1 n=1 Tax=Zavarzinia compransoris TaxID=1264899 RepID=A0A317DWS3_9PROT|nr:type I-E CRISPR-associated endonuclease Cas1e [Zavarzinia compransoris]PWR18804.1 type I-E CRISPR-associated endonuclease Cas1 [Zavarzinia compransoris]TDP48791.1 CRISPR-associated Cas1 family protein [Zavarzinia compransoris]
MLKGRLGLETARVPHADRQGLLWLARGNIHVEDGTLRFRAAGDDGLPPGDYAIPFQAISLLLMGPGTTISHDALRLLARHGTGLAAIGEGGVRLYTAPPLGPDDSRLARLQAAAWADTREGSKSAAQAARLDVARRLYAWRLGEVLPHRDIAVLRGIEGARMKETYRLLAQKYGIRWEGRRYDRSRPDAADAPNQAINHAASAVEAAAAIAVAATGTIPSLGFIHEDSGNAFILDIADLYRDSLVLPGAFEAVRQAERQPGISLERHVRRQITRRLQADKVIPGMIDRIKALFDPAAGRPPAPLPAADRGSEEDGAPW